MLTLLIRPFVCLPVRANNLKTIPQILVIFSYHLGSTSVSVCTEDGRVVDPDGGFKNCFPLFSPFCFVSITREDS